VLEFLAFVLWIFLKPTNANIRMVVLIYLFSIKWLISRVFGDAVTVKRDIIILVVLMTD
jgi:hypothetical protein